MTEGHGHVTTAEPTAASHPRWAAVAEALQAPASALDGTTRQTMEPRFGFDFGNLRIHTDARAATAARALDAHAFTFGEHIVFGEGAYRPADPWGRSLLMHELTHAVAQPPAGADLTGPFAETTAHESAAIGMAGSGHVAAAPRFAAPAIQRAGIFENIARFFGGGTFPVQELTAYLALLRRTRAIEGNFDSDNKARDVVRRGRAGETQFSGLTEPIRVLLIKEMLDGHVSTADENAILDLLTEAPAPEAARMIVAAGGESPFLREFGGANLKRFKALVEATEIAPASAANWTAARLRAILRHEGRESVIDTLAALGWGVWSFRTAFDTWRYPNGRVEPEEVDGLRGNTDRGAKLIRIQENLDDEGAAATLVHEAVHATAGPSATQEAFLQQEVDARVRGEEYRIQRGLPPTNAGYRRPDGTVDAAFIHAEIFASPHYNPTTRQRVGRRRWVGDHAVPGMPAGTAPAAAVGAAP